MSGKMHQLLAVEPDLTKRAEALITEAMATFGKSDRFEGQVRSVAMFDDARLKENTSDTKEVTTTVDEKLGFVVPEVSRLFDALLQKETANQVAKADLVVNGKTLAKDVPATYLLGMEKRLQSIRDRLLLTIPTLDPNLSWAENQNLRTGVVQSQTIESYKTEKVSDVLVLYPATDKHPAQVKEVTLDRNVAKITLVKRSGMWPVSRKAKVLANIDSLIEAVKKARMAANDTTVPDVHIAGELFKFILS